MFSSKSFKYMQEAMENFVFPDEIKTKLMKMSKFKNISYIPKNYGKVQQAAISVHQKHQWNVQLFHSQMMCVETR